MARIIISGGGTGGHVYPAISIAHAIQRQAPGTEILFIGALGRLEMEKVPLAGFPIEGLPIAGFQRRFAWNNLLIPGKVLVSLWKARSIIRRFAPHCVVGVGGYASGPTLRAASSMGIPTLIQEQNSFPGVTNRLLGRKAARICVAYPGMDRYFPVTKITLTGNPVRKDLLNLTAHQPEAYAYFRLNPERKTVLVLGGSGGSSTINNSIRRLVQSGCAQSLQMIWQTGNHYFTEIREKVSPIQAHCPDPDSPSATEEQRPAASDLTNIRIVPFIDRMDYAYSCADVVVSRAGAMAISELCVTGKPSILIPSPNVAEDHQTKNARALSVVNAAYLIPDQEAEDKLSGEIMRLLDHPELREQLSRNIRKLAIPDSDDRIASEVLKLIIHKPFQDGF